jgi:nitrate reductase assembly molybdenum cofactor insertion protein NarJ
MSSVQTLDAEREKLDEVAKTYRAKGYAVTRRPAPEHLPSFIRFLPICLSKETTNRSLCV